MRNSSVANAREVHVSRAEPERISPVLRRVCVARASPSRLDRRIPRTIQPVHPAVEVHELQHPVRRREARRTATAHIDVSRDMPSPPGIFVIWDGVGLVAKRIEHVPHSDPPRVVLKSLNPEYDSYERSADEIRIVGRAVWVSRRL